MKQWFVLHFEKLRCNKTGKELVNTKCSNFLKRRSYSNKIVVTWNKTDSWQICVTQWSAFLEVNNRKLNWLHFFVPLTTGPVQFKEIRYHSNCLWQKRTKYKWINCLMLWTFRNIRDILPTFSPHNLLFIDEILVFLHRPSFSTSGHLPFNVPFAS